MISLREALATAGASAYLDNPPQLARLADRCLKGVRSEFVDLRWSGRRLHPASGHARFERSGVLRYASRKSVPGRLTTISSPSSSTWTSMDEAITKN